MTASNDIALLRFGTDVMRAILFIVTFTLVFCGASVAGSTDRLPNAGLFVFDVTPIALDAPTVVASR